jgi:hypothetical protein
MDDLQFRGLEPLEIPVKSEFLSRNVYRQNTNLRDKLKLNQAYSQTELNFYCPSFAIKTGVNLCLFFIVSELLFLKSVEKNLPF